MRLCLLGLKIDLNDEQKEVIIIAKDDTLLGKDRVELINQGIVKFTRHSVERLIQRFKGNLSDLYLLVIEMIQKSTVVDDKAEWRQMKYYLK
ncbi:hypothetical protein [Pseudogracilibacillus sp. SO10305]|uniref:hypothetical protein n=1 Tax=Pseudogracilibacillus sp. SO10305 TaxID=3098292 RepID=UPI00300E5590